MAAHRRPIFHSCSRMTPKQPALIPRIRHVGRAQAFAPPRLPSLALLVASVGQSIITGPGHGQFFVPTDPARPSPIRPQLRLGPCSTAHWPDCQWARSQSTLLPSWPRQGHNSLQLPLPMAVLHPPTDRSNGRSEPTCLNWWRRRLASGWHLMGRHRRCRRRLESKGYSRIE